MQKALTQAEKRRNVKLSSILFLQNSQDTIFGNDLFFTIWRASTVFTAKSMKNCYYFIAFVSILTSLSGVISRLYLGIPWYIDNDWRIIVFLSFSLFSNLTMTGLNILWMVMTYFDMKRRLFVFQRWTALLSAKMFRCKLCKNK